MKKKPLEEISQHLKGSKLTLISDEYNGKYFTVACECGEMFETYWRIIRQGKKACNQCSYSASQEPRKHTIETVKKWVEENSTSKLLSTEYVTCKDKLILQCECGEIYQTTFDQLSNKKRGEKKVCADCQLGRIANLNDERNAIKKETFLLRVKELTGAEYVFHDKYVHSKHKLTVTHKTCGNTYKVDPDHFLNHRRRCPECFDNKNSKWAYEVERYLNVHSVNYLKEYSFEDCVYRKQLKFDFAILAGDSLIGLIEVDGQQHFEPFRYIKDEEVRLKKFEEGKTRDAIKDEYCKKNDISLIRIPYHQIDNIDNLLRDMMLPKQVV